MRGAGMDEQRVVKPPAAEISTEAVGVLREYTGRGPTKAKTMINEDVVTLLLADTLTKGERRLAANGHAERILALRHDYQQVMREDLMRAQPRMDRRARSRRSRDDHSPRPLK
jgi:uncharacterized protein YbcI